MKNLFLSILLFFAACSVGFSQEEDLPSCEIIEFRFGVGASFSPSLVVNYDSNKKQLNPQMGYKIGIGATSAFKTKNGTHLIFNHDLGYQNNKLIVTDNVGKLKISQINFSSSICTNKKNGINGGLGFGIMINTGNSLEGKSPGWRTEYHWFSKISTGPIISLGYRREQISFSGQGFFPIRTNYTSLFPPNAIYPGPKNPKGDINWRIFSFDFLIFYYFQP